MPFPKAPKSNTMRNLIVVILCFVSSIIVAQDVHVWQGGTPGNETNWDEPKNWSNQEVPSEDSYVVIKLNNTGHYSQPEITGKVVIASLELQSNATLKIHPAGELLIDGTYTYTEGISMYGGKLNNLGTLELNNIDVSQTKVIALQAMNEGRLIVNGKVQNEQFVFQVSN
ncbi:MAG: hypothetical protein DWQ02_02505 [Bacteroidetes bacterium]|nr:MAG: hypothetical protein DWQ02_02505 [Bacteroidota bacterium]